MFHSAERELLFVQLKVGPQEGLLVPMVVASSVPMVVASFVVQVVASLVHRWCQYWSTPVVFPQIWDGGVIISA